MNCFIDPFKKVWPKAQHLVGSDKYISILTDFTSWKKVPFLRTEPENPNKWFVLSEI